MMKNGHTLKWALGCFMIGAVSFLIGSSYGQRTMLRKFSPEYNGIQAMLAFNRLDDERHWEYLLKSGCIAQATKAIDVAQDEDEALLAGFYKEQLDQSTLRYIHDRDPTLEGQLKTFKSKYGKTWRENGCKH